MRLITKTILYYLLIALPLLAIAGYFSYRFINREVKGATDESLYREKMNLQNLITSLKLKESVYLREDSLSSIIPIAENKKGYRFYDTLVYDKLEEEMLEYRVFTSYFYFNNTGYRITCARPALEEDELKEGLITASLLLLGLLLATFFLLNIWLSRTLWQPFYKTISLLDKFDPASNEVLRFDAVSIKEFRQLNSALAKLTEKISNDFKLQKEFSENASHELQTPLAVIRTKLELLVQSNKIGEEESEILAAMEHAVQKISSLNKALLLLTKIDNQQFREQKEIDLEPLVINALETYSDLYPSKKIEIEIKKEEKTIIQMNPLLAELLVNNLVKNAFRHNLDNGSIEVLLRKDSFCIRNSGEAMQIDPTELFERFKKNKSSSESLGLGLSIVKSILNTYGFHIQYDHNNGHHTFTVSFKK